MTICITPCKTIATMVFCHIANWGGKILYRESDIERVFQSCYRGKF